jgi:hypothetical protein
MNEGTRSLAHKSMMAYAYQAQGKKKHGILDAARSNPRYGLPILGKGRPVQQRRSVKNLVHDHHVTRNDSWVSGHHSDLGETVHQRDGWLCPLSFEERILAVKLSSSETQRQKEIECPLPGLLQGIVSYESSVQMNTVTWTPMTRGLRGNALPMLRQTGPLLGMERSHFLKALEASGSRRLRRWQHCQAIMPQGTPGLQI